MEQRKVFLFTQLDFLEHMISGHFEAKGISLLTINQAEDFAYLIEDFHPQVLIIDQRMLHAHLELFQDQLPRPSDLCYHILLLKNPDVEETYLVDFQSVDLPVSMDELVDKVKNMLMPSN